jgi:hypothetical protein
MVIMMFAFRISIGGIAIFRHSHIFPYNIPAKLIVKDSAHPFPRSMGRHAPVDPKEIDGWCIWQTWNYNQQKMEGRASNQRVKESSVCSV